MCPILPYFYLLQKYTHMNENLYESQFSIDKYAYDDDAEMMMMAV
jgi:hypothetical protein